MSTRLLVMMRSISAVVFAGASSWPCASALAYFCAAAVKLILSLNSFCPPAVSVQITSHAAGMPGTQT